MKHSNWNDLELKKSNDCLTRIRGEVPRRGRRLLAVQVEVPEAVVVKDILDNEFQIILRDQIGDLVREAVMAALEQDSKKYKAEVLEVELLEEESLPLLPVDRNEQVHQQQRILDKLDHLHQPHHKFRQSLQNLPLVVPQPQHSLMPLNAGRHSLHIGKD